MNSDRKTELGTALADAEIAVYRAKIKVLQVERLQPELRQRLRRLQLGLGTDRVAIAKAQAALDANIGAASQLKVKLAEAEAELSRIKRKLSLDPSPLGALLMGSLGVTGLLGENLHAQYSLKYEPCLRIDSGYNDGLIGDCTLDETNPSKNSFWADLGQNDPYRH